MFNVQIEVTKENIEALLITSIEGGSNYWCMYGTSVLPESDKPTSLDDAILNFVMASPDNKVPIYDVEDYEEDEEEDSFLGFVSMETIINGTQKFIQQCPERWASVIEEDYDAEDADVWFQMVVMGKIVYG
jgi:hypothetical protein